MEEQIHERLHNKAKSEVPSLLLQYEALEGSSVVELVKRGLAVPQPRAW